jgi:hypothetical protein
MRRGGGVYAYRTRKPGARFRIPFLSFHWGYVGETKSFARRHAQHIEGGGSFQSIAKPWSDLDPRCVIRIPLPPWKWLLHSVETVLITCTWPVYNHAKNQWNPRRIPLRAQVRQRALRNRLGWSPNVRPAHLLILATLAVVAYIVWRTS